MGSALLWNYTFYKCNVIRLCKVQVSCSCMMKQVPGVEVCSKCDRCIQSRYCRFPSTFPPPDKYSTNRIARAISSWETANCCTCGPRNGSALFVRAGPVPNILRKSILGLHLGAAQRDHYDPETNIYRDQKAINRPSATRIMEVFGRPVGRANCSAYRAGSIIGTDHT